MTPHNGKQQIDCTGACMQNVLTSKICIFHIPINIFIFCENILAENCLQRTFCDHILYITNVCRHISRVTKVALLNNVHNES